MIERAREEESSKAAVARKQQHKKPLFQRILEKAQADSDREEKEKIESYKQKATQKMKQRIPPPLPLPPPPMAAKPGRGRRNELGSQPSSDTEIRGRRATAKNKVVPLYERLAARAKVDADREANEKAARYNVIRMQKQAAKAPTREEVRERERLLEAELERIRDAKPKRARHNSLERRASTSPPGLAPRDPHRDRHESEGSLFRGRSSPQTVRAARQYRPSPSFDDTAAAEVNHRQHIDANGSGGRGHEAHRRNNNIDADTDAASLDHRSVKYNVDDNDLSNSLFSPLSMDSHSRHSSGPRRRKAGGRLGARAAALAAARQPQFAEDVGVGADADDDDDDDVESEAGKSLLSKLASARVSSPAMRKKVGVAGGSVGSTDSAKGAGQSRVRFQADDSSDVTAGPAEASTVVAMKGDAYLASLLEADAGEGDRATMYAEGFQMFFEDGRL